MLTLVVSQSLALVASIHFRLQQAQVTIMKLILTLLALISLSTTVVLSHPLAVERAVAEDGMSMMIARAAPKKPAPHHDNKPKDDHKSKSKAPAPKKAPVDLTHGEKPGALPSQQDLMTVNGHVAKGTPPPPPKIPCKQLSDCHCGSGPGSSTSCINGFCSCNNPIIKGISNETMNIFKAVGNSAVVKAMGNLMQGISDVKEVAGIIAGAVLGPEAKAALKAALNVIPDTGPSHIDQASKGVLRKLL